MRPTTAFHDNVFDINVLLHPGTVFDHPKDILADLSLSVSEKRAILAFIGRIGDRFVSRLAGTSRP